MSLPEIRFYFTALSILNELSFGLEKRCKILHQHQKCFLHSRMVWNRNYPLLFLFISKLFCFPLFTDIFCIGSRISRKEMDLQSRNCNFFADPIKQTHFSTQHLINCLNDENCKMHLLCCQIVFPFDLIFIQNRRIGAARNWSPVWACFRKTIVIHCRIQAILNLRKSTVYYLFPNFVYLRHEARVCAQRGRELISLGVSRDFVSSMMYVAFQSVFQFFTQDHTRTIFANLSSLSTIT